MTANLTIDLTSPIILAFFFVITNNFVKSKDKVAKKKLNKNEAK